MDLKNEIILLLGFPFWVIQNATNRPNKCFESKTTVINNGIFHRKCGPLTDNEHNILSDWWSSKSNGIDLSKPFISFKQCQVLYYITIIGDGKSETHQFRNAFNSDNRSNRIKFYCGLINSLWKLNLTLIFIFNTTLIRYGWSISHHKCNNA